MGVLYIHKDLKKKKPQSRLEELQRLEKYEARGTSPLILRGVSSLDDMSQDSCSMQCICLEERIKTSTPNKKRKEIA